MCILLICIGKYPSEDYCLLSMWKGLYRWLASSPGSFFSPKKGLVLRLTVCMNKNSWIMHHRIVSIHMLQLCVLYITTEDSNTCTPFRIVNWLRSPGPACAGTCTRSSIAYICSVDPRAAIKEVPALCVSLGTSTGQDGYCWVIVRTGRSTHPQRSELFNKEVKHENVR